jgi:hypothetical protein
MYVEQPESEPAPKPSSLSEKSNHSAERSDDMPTAKELRKVSDEIQSLVGAPEAELREAIPDRREFILRLTVLASNCAALLANLDPENTLLKDVHLGIRHDLSGMDTPSEGQ